METLPTNTSPRFNGAEKANPVVIDERPIASEVTGAPNANENQTCAYDDFISLYVGDLSTDITDLMLFEFFKKAGLNIATVKVCRDPESGKAFGYGFANFLVEEDATLAMTTLNNKVLYGKQIRLMWHNRFTEARLSGIGNLHVKNLSLSIDNARLHEIFGNFGSILSAKVMRNADGSSRRYGYVQFETKEFADSAVEALNGTDVDGNKILVSHYVKKRDRSAHDPNSFNNIIVKNIDEDIDEMLIRLKFSKFGNITSIKVEKDANGNSKGFCFICFEKPENAKMAVDEMNGLQMGSKILYVGRAMKKAEYAEHLKSQKNKNETNLFVKNLGDKVDDSILQEHFSQCGTVTSAKVMYSDNGVSKGYGFVCYLLPEEAQKAIATLNCQFFYGKPLYVAQLERKEKRKARLAEYFRNLALNHPSPTVPIMYPHGLYQPSEMNIVQAPVMQYTAGTVGATWSTHNHPYSSFYQPAPFAGTRRFHNMRPNNTYFSRNYGYRTGANYHSPRNHEMKYVPVGRFDVNNNNASTSASLPTNSW